LEEESEEVHKNTIENNYFTNANNMEKIEYSR